MTCAQGHWIFGAETMRLRVNRLHVVHPRVWDVLSDATDSRATCDLGDTTC